MVSSRYGRGSMNHDRALHAVAAVRVGHVKLGWASPAVSICLAAERARGVPVRVEFLGRASPYASLVGLDDAIAGVPSVCIRAAPHGQPFSPLERLHAHEHIHRCNASIGQLLERRLRGDRHRKLSTIHDDVDAMRWAFVRGNTSAPLHARADFGPQRGLDDRRLEHAEGDEHAGWGLDELRKMIDQTNGCLSVASGTAAFLYSARKWSPYAPPTPWPGVFIEIEVPRGGSTT